MATSVSWAALQVPEIATTVDLTDYGTASGAAVGQPLVEVPTGPARSIKLTWAEMELPNTNEVVFLSAVTSASVVGSPVIGFDQPVVALPVVGISTVGSPSTFSGTAVSVVAVPDGVGSVVAVGQPIVGEVGVMDGSGTIYGPETPVTASPTGIVRTPAVGAPVVTHIVTTLPSSVGSVAFVGSPGIREGDSIVLEYYGVITRAAVGSPVVISGMPVVTTSVGTATAVGTPMVAVADTTAHPQPVNSVAAVGTPNLAQVGGAIARPIADLAVGAWTSSNGGALWDDLDEPVPVDADYITTTSSGAARIALSPIADPGVHTGHVVRYRIRGNGATTVRVALLQGPLDTEIAGWTHAPAPNNWQTFEQLLTPTQAGTITDYSALRLDIAAS